MAIPGIFYGSLLGPHSITDVVTHSGLSQNAMAALNTGWCARFRATQNKDIKSVRVNFASVTTPGVITIRIETIDATTGKPTGTLYDANASVTLVPAAGWNTATFASLPTTNLTVGTEYALLLLTTTAGTTQTLRSHIAQALLSTYPNILLTAADGTTRSNFAEVNNSVPAASFVLDDDTEDPMGLLPYAAGTQYNIFGTEAAALKITTVGTTVVAGVDFSIGRNGTPAGDLRVRIFDSGNSTVANSTVTLDKDSLVNAGTKRCMALFDALVSLAAGTYRVVFDSASSANSSNCWRLGCAIPAVTAVVPDNFITSTCPDVGTPVWTDSATAEQPPVRLLVDSLSAGGGGGLLTHPGMSGGARG